MFFFRDFSDIAVHNNRLRDHDIMSSQKQKYEIYAIKYAGPFASSGAFILWMREWEKTIERYYFFWCIKGEGGPIVMNCCVSPKLANKKKLKGYVPDTWRYRSGKFRIFYTVDQDEEIIYMLTIDHRKDAYR